MLKFKTIEDLDLQNKTLIIREDYNVPIKDGIVTDESRVIESIETIKYALSNGAKYLILLSHMGKIKTEEDKKENDLRVVIPILEKYLKVKVDFLEHTSGEELIKEIEQSQTNGFKIGLVQNTRYEDLNNKRESKNSEELGKFYASLADYAIFDGWGVSHRNNASTSSMFMHSNSAVGYLVLRELSKINGFLEEEATPFTIVMGGKKIEDKIPVIKNLIDKCDKLVIGGAMAFTFLKAKGYKVGKSLVDEESLEFCKELLSKYSDKIVLPIDFVTNKKDNCKIEEFEDDEIGYDIGANTINKFIEILKDSKKILMNGTMGKNEETKYENGTKEIFMFISNLAQEGVKVLVGGGDSASAAFKYMQTDKVYHISTGGGATLKYLGNELGDIFSIITAQSKENGIKKIKKISN